MLRVGRHRHERTPPQTQQIVLPYQPQHHQAIAAQLGRDPSIAITPAGQRNALDRIAHDRLLLAWQRYPQMPAVAGAIHAREHTHPFHREFALPSW
jgi:hypothetical protein